MSRIYDDMGNDVTDLYVSRADYDKLAAEYAKLEKAVAKEEAKPPKKSPKKKEVT